MRSGSVRRCRRHRGRQHDPPSRSRRSRAPPGSGHRAHRPATPPRPQAAPLTPAGSVALLLDGVADADTPSADRSGGGRGAVPQPDPVVGVLRVRTYGAAQTRCVCDVGPGGGRVHPVRWHGRGSRLILTAHDAPDRSPFRHVQCRGEMGGKTTFRPELPPDCRSSQRTGRLRDPRTCVSRLAALPSPAIALALPRWPAVPGSSPIRPNSPAVLSASRCAAVRRPRAGGSARGGRNGTGRTGRS